MQPEADGSKQRGTFGLNSIEEDARQASAEVSSTAVLYGRPLEALAYTSWAELQPRERLQVAEAMRSTLVGAHVDFEFREGDAIQNFNYKTLVYTLQGDLAQTGREISMFDNIRYRAYESPTRKGLTPEMLEVAGPDLNERLLGWQEAQLLRHKASLTVFDWALWYKMKYYSGMESMGLLPERGGQLFLGDMQTVVHGVRADWLEEPTPLDPTQFPKVLVDERAKQIEEWNAIKEYLPLIENGETVADRYGRYVAETDYFTRVVGEMNTHNPIIPGEKMNVSETTQHFLADSLQKKPRVFETGKREVIDTPTRRIEVYLDDNGEQIPYQVDAQGRQIRPAGIKPENIHTAYVEVMDYYNKKSRSEDEMKMYICVMSALAIHRAKGVLDRLPPDIASAMKVMSSDGQTTEYDRLFAEVQKTALRMYKNFDMPPKADFNQKLARSAFYLSDAIAFGSFDIAERGWGYEWKQVPIYDPRDAKLAKSKRRVTGYKWHAEPSQGDPTASGDAFSAAKPYFHDVVYQAIKARASSFLLGANVAVSNEAGEKMAQIFVSEAAEINDRDKTIKMIADGKHQYLATYFGVLGAFEKELGHLKAYQEGVKKREDFGKKVNPNFSKAVEQYVVFAPTPFNFDHVNLNSKKKKDKALIEYVKASGVDKGEGIIYPMLAPQQKIGLYDMLSAGKEYTVGDMLRKTWTKVVVDDAKGPHIELVETPPEQGGVRLTYQDIDWELYARYAEDARAVNDNFMLQLFSPIYGPMNSKSVDLVKENPLLAIGLSIKAADISLRNVIKRFDNPTDKSGKTVQRPSLEILHGASNAFQQLALGAHGLIGRGNILAFKAFVEERPAGSTDKHNMYSLLRNAEDLIGNKQGYEDYADTWCAAFMAMTLALEPVALASNNMADATTFRYFNADPTDIEKWNKLTESDETLNMPLKRSGRFDTPMPT